MMKMNLTLFGETCQHAVKELAEELNISRNTACQLADQKDFPSFRIGRRLLINRTMLQEWLNQNSLPQLCPT